MVPLAPSARWLACFLKSISLEEPYDRAVVEANEKMAQPKDFARLSLVDNHSDPLVLSVAVEGGGRQLRNLDKIPDLKLSNHGDWRKVHLGAFESILGKTPFYRHFEDSLRKVYDDKDITGLKNFNSAIFNIIDSFILKDIRQGSLAGFFCNPLLMQRGSEMASKIHPDSSVIQAMANFGKESLLGFLALNILQPK